MQRNPAGVRVGVSGAFSRAVRAEYIDLYAEITGDRNPLHFSEDFVSRTRYKSAIMHGGVASGMLNALVAERVPGPGSVFLRQELDYRAPTRPGDFLTAHGIVSWVHATKPVCHMLVRVENQTGEVVLDGKVVVYRMIPDAEREAEAAELARQDELLSIAAIGARAGEMLALCESGKTAIRYDASRLPAAATRILKRIQSSDSILAHSRLRHLGAKLAQEGWPPSNRDEEARRLLDLVFVSVLLDTDPGSEWAFEDVDKSRHTRAAGTALATLRMFSKGSFSVAAAAAAGGQSLQVDAQGLLKLTPDAFLAGFQVNHRNTLPGALDRLRLLKRLGYALRANAAVFGDDGRPGRLLDHLTRDGSKTVDVAALWTILVDTIGSVLERPDVWEHDALSAAVPLHSLTLWLTYSVVDVLVTRGELEITGQLPALSDSRIGGLLFDTSVLVGPAAVPDDPLKAGDAAIVEARALTIAVIARLHDQVRKELGSDLSLPRLVAAAWLEGLALAEELRPGGPPPPPF